MDNSTEQTELLRAIWNELKATRETLTARIDTTNERLDSVRQELGARIDATNERLTSLRSELKQEIIRLRTDVTELRGEVSDLRGDVGGLKAEVVVLGRRIDNVFTGEHGHQHQELLGRVDRIEKHLGLPPQG